MKRKYIKPTTSVVRVETQNNYCAATSNNQWVIGKKFYDNGHVDLENDDTDRGYFLTDKDIKEGMYDPWDSDKW